MTATTVSHRPPAVSTDGTDVLGLYRRHLGSGRAVMGQVFGGMVEVASEGAWVHVEDGRRFLDLGGYGVFILGHRHPAVVEAVHRQIDLHPLATRVFLEPVAARAAAALAAVTPEGLDQVHFVNSGTEATEAALKLARVNGHSTVITTRSGFHGKTLGALSVTANPKYQDPFRPLLPGVVEVPFGDAEAMRAELARHGSEACVILEPVQGEGGVRIPPPGYLRQVAQLCTEYGAFLVVDEIQTGLGRLGSWWGVNGDHGRRPGTADDAATGVTSASTADAADVVPDVLLVGKGLSGGVVPAAAVVATERAYRPFGRDPYLHTSTFGASPLACAAALAAVETIEREDVVRRSAVLGEQLLTDLRELCAPYLGTLVREVRGKGLLLGIEFLQEQAVGEVVLALLDRNVLVNHSLNSSLVMRLTPPVLLGEEELALFRRALTDSLAAVAARMGI